ncbi:hypothetical protein JCM17960_26810 [Magnetospira thiophila]
MQRRTIVISALVATVLSGVVALSVARANGWGPGGCPLGGPQGGYGQMGQMGPMGYGPMRGGYGPHGMRGGGPAAMICSGRTEGMAARMLDRITWNVELNDAQKVKLEAARQAVRDSSETLKSVCNTPEFSQTSTSPVARMAQMENGMAAALAALQNVRPAVEDFYNTLTPEQQQAVDTPTRGWRR